MFADPTSPDDAQLTRLLDRFYDDKSTLLIYLYVSKVANVILDCGIISDMSHAEAEVHLLSAEDMLTYRGYAIQSTQKLTA